MFSVPSVSRGGNKPDGERQMVGVTHENEKGKIKEQQTPGEREDTNSYNTESELNLNSNHVIDCC